MPVKTDHLEFYKEVYYKELDRRNSLNTEIALQGTTLVAIVSGLFFLLTNLKSEQAWIHHLFTVLVALETIIALIAAHFVMRSYYDFIRKGRRFTYLPKMKDVELYRSQVAKAEFTSYMTESFVEACDSHIEHNDHKSIMLTRASKWMAFLVIGGAVTTLVFIDNYLYNNPNIQTTKHGIQKPKHPTAATAARPASATTANATGPVNSTTAVAPVGRTRGQDALQNKVRSRRSNKHY